MARTKRAMQALREPLTREIVLIEALLHTCLMLLLGASLVLAVSASWRPLAFLAFAWLVAGGFIAPWWLKTRVAEAMTSRSVRSFWHILGGVAIATSLAVMIAPIAWMAPLIVVGVTFVALGLRVLPAGWASGLGARSAAHQRLAVLIGHSVGLAILLLVSLIATMGTDGFGSAPFGQFSSAAAQLSATVALICATVHAGMLLAAARSKKAYIGASLFQVLPTAQADDESIVDLLRQLLGRWRQPSAIRLLVSTAAVAAVAVLTPIIAFDSGGAVYVVMVTSCTWGALELARLAVDYAPTLLVPRRGQYLLAVLTGALGIAGGLTSSLAVQSVLLVAAGMAVGVLSRSVEKTLLERSGMTIAPRLTEVWALAWLVVGFIIALPELLGVAHTAVVLLSILTAVAFVGVVIPTWKKLRARQRDAEQGADLSAESTPSTVSAAPGGSGVQPTEVLPQNMRSQLMNSDNTRGKNSWRSRLRGAVQPVTSFLFAPDRPRTEQSDDVIPARAASVAPPTKPAADAPATEIIDASTPAATEERPADDTPTQAVPTEAAPTEDAVTPDDVTPDDKQASTRRIDQGVFIAVEGGDGAGKSSLVRALVDALGDMTHQPVIMTREPGGSALGKQIRSLVLGNENITPKAEALLFAADRAHHVETVILPAVRRGQVVVTDRYIDSSVAYQGAGRSLEPDQVAALSRWATNGIVPDLTILLDLDPEVAASRRADDDSRDGDDRMESEDLTFHKAVRESFLSLAMAAPERYLVVDASAPQQAVIDAVIEETATFFGADATKAAASLASDANWESEDDENYGEGAPAQASDEPAGKDDTPNVQDSDSTSTTDDEGTDPVASADAADVPDAEDTASEKAKPAQTASDDAASGESVVSESDVEHVAEDTSSDDAPTNDDSEVDDEPQDSVDVTKAIDLAPATEAIAVVAGASGVAAGAAGVVDASPATEVLPIVKLRGDEQGDDTPAPTLSSSELTVPTAQVDEVKVVAEEADSDVQVEPKLVEAEEDTPAPLVVEPVISEPELIEIPDANSGDSATEAETDKAADDDTQVDVVDKAVASEGEVSTDDSDTEADETADEPVVDTASSQDGHDTVGMIPDDPSSDESGTTPDEAGAAKASLLYEGSMFAGEGVEWAPERLPLEEDGPLGDGHGPASAHERSDRAGRRSAPRWSQEVAGENPASAPKKPWTPQPLTVQDFLAPESDEEQQERRSAYGPFGAYRGRGERSTRRRIEDRRLNKGDEESDAVVWLRGDDAQGDDTPDSPPESGFGAR